MIQFRPHYWDWVHDAAFIVAGVLILTVIGSSLWLTWKIWEAICE